MRLWRAYSFVLYHVRLLQPPPVTFLLYRIKGSPANDSVLESPVPLFTGLGLGASSTARRDSFDRNTSAFSPSLEYSRAKWPQSYGALGKCPS